MKPTNKYFNIKNTIILIVILLIIYLIYRFYKNWKAETPRIQSESDAVKDIKDLYGLEIAKNVERIYRLETNNFKSEQYKKSGSAGMLRQGESTPFGWSSLAQFWLKHSNYAPTEKIVTFIKNDEETGLPKVYNYLAFDDFGGFYSLAEFLNQYNNNAGRWFSTDETLQNNYINTLNSIETKFV